MTPYYEQDGVTIYHGDCRQILPTLTVAVVATDPPYGIEHGKQPFQGGAVRPRNGKYAAPVNTWHPESDWDAAIDPEWPKLACGAAQIVAWFGHWRKRAEVEAAMPWPIRCEIVWAKDTHVGPPCPLGMQDERIWVFSRDGVKPQRFDTTVWSMPVIPTWEYRHHKNQKPEALMLRLLTWLPVGDVCDPFMGSGTTLVAAKRLGRRAIGIELEEKYCEIAAKRLQQGALPMEFSA